MRVKFELLRSPADEGGGAAAPAPEPAASDGPSASTGDALVRAFESMGIGDDDFQEAPPEPAGEPQTGEDGEGGGDTATGPKRGPDGRFQPREASADGDKPPADPKPAAEPKAETAEAPAEKAETGEAPAWMSDAAKAKWAEVPVEVRADTARRLRELEGGIRQYQERSAELEPYIRRAEKDGTTLAQALQNYTGMEELLVRDPLQGLGQICQALGTDLRTVAAHVLGQPQPQRDQVIDGLQQHIRRLEEQIGGVTSTMQQQREAAAIDQVSKFAAAHPHFDAVSGDIERLLRTGYYDPRDPAALDQAYEAACKLRGIATEPQTLAPSTADQTRASPPAPQDRKAGISVQGAPGRASGTVQRSSSTEDAVARAFAKVGLSS